MISDERKLIDYLKFIYPLCLYSLLQQIYGIIDIVNGSFIGSNEMSYIVYIDQSLLIILALGNSLAIGVSVLVSKRTNGEKKDEIKTLIANTFFLMLTISIGFILFIVFFHNIFLKLILAPTDFYGYDNTYLIIRAFNIMFLFLNLCLFSVEKAKGNTKKVFNINICGILIKVILSLIVIKFSQMTLVTIGIITIGPTIAIFLLNVREYLKTSNEYQISIRHLKLNSYYVKELLAFSLPLFFSLCIFNIGKMLVNVQALRYGVEAVGYLGISNRLVGLMVGLSTGVQEGVSILLAKYKEQDQRKVKFIINTSVLVNIGIALCGLLFYGIYFKEIVMYFAHQDVAVASQIGVIFALELTGAMLLPLTNFINGMLYGYEKTKTVFIISFFRIIIFRNFVLFVLSFTQMGTAALGVAMFISHVGTFIVSVIVTKIELKKEKE